MTSLSDTRVFRPFCWCHDMPSRRAPTHARALMAQRSGNVWRLRRTCYPLNSFNYKSRRTRCPRVGVSLECDVQSWNPSASGGISRAKRNLRQLFLHPRAANEEPDKVERPILDSTPSHRAVAPPAGPNDEVDICVTRHFLKNHARQL